MKPRYFRLPYEYFETVIGKPLPETQAILISGWEIVEILWLILVGLANELHDNKITALAQELPPSA
jgi:hypothetical protein